MKPQKIIDNYCRFYGVTMPALDLAETQYFVTISPAGAEVLYLRKPSKLLGRVVGEAMKRGTVLSVHNGWVTLLTWEQWGKTWHKFFEPQKRNTAPVPNWVRPFRSEIFESAQQKRPYKNPRKQGFSRTAIANHAMELISQVQNGMRVEHF